MATILLLVHRLPYPPNKGDKVRSYHLLKHLARRHEVFLGTFVDDPDDERHVATVRGLCAGMHVARLKPSFARLRSLAGLLRGEPLTLPYYRDSGLGAWVSEICRTKGVDAAVVFSSAMAQYLGDFSRQRTLIDFVDVDSAKWAHYARTHRGPKAWIYRREGELLLGYERQLAEGAARGFFVTEKETDLFRGLAPECGAQVEAMCNGVDAEYFRPDESIPSPFAGRETAIVFTGAMDYHPNEDAAIWFAREVMPHLASQRPNVRYYIVGRSPTPAVQALASRLVTVTGTVPDVRPYLQHAAVVVAPLRIARGVQNKILEAMSMARPVIASAACAGGIDAAAGSEFLVAGSVEEYVRQLDELLGDSSRAEAIGHAARQHVLDHYSWEAHLSNIDRHISAVSEKAAASSEGRIHG